MRAASAFTLLLLAAPWAAAGDNPAQCPEFVLQQWLLTPPFADGPLTAPTSPECVTEEGLALGTPLVARWFHDATGLSVAVSLDGPGIDPAPHPMAEQAYVTVGSPVDHRTLYESDTIPLPSGFRGVVTATLLVDGAPVATASARTVQSPTPPTPPTVPTPPVRPAAPEVACRELEVLNDYEVVAGPASVAASYTADVACGGDADGRLILPATIAVVVSWAHAEPGLAGLGVVVDGPGIPPTAYAVTERGYLQDGVARPVHYATSFVPLPTGFQGTLHAALYRDGALVEETEATAPHPVVGQASLP